LGAKNAQLSDYAMMIQRTAYFHNLNLIEYSRFLNVEGVDEPDGNEDDDEGSEPMRN